ncbi:MAG: mechanosensitive ion channel family protein [Cyanobacteria bacterium P01_A01_bin.105]
MTVSRFSRPWGQLLSQETAGLGQHVSRCCARCLLSGSIAVLIVLLNLVGPLEGVAQTPPPEASADVEVAPAPALVILGGEELFSIEASVGSFSPQDRADAITRRLIDVAEEASIGAADIRVKGQGETLNVVAGNRILVTMTAADAVAADQPLTLLAENRRNIVRDGVVQYRQERTSAYLRRALINTAWATGVFVLAIAFIAVAYPRLVVRIRRWRQRRIQSLRIRNIELLAAERLTQILYIISRVVQALLYFVAFYIYVPLVLSFFPWTKAIGRGVLVQVHRGLTSIWQAFVDYLPSLFSVLFVVALTYYLLRFLRHFFKALGEQTITIDGFYPDWAQPTFRLLALIIIALSGVIVFPYLPGFGSPAFQGVSIFLGVLFSLGSTAVVSNVVAGIILVYTRAFQPGDRVKIGDATGDIVNKSLLVTRIRTVKNVVITLPNSTVFTSQIINYSASQADPEEPPLILNTTVTLGYDVPWRLVHETLLAAAEATEMILTEPKPFVLQTSLDDFYVSYELNVYTHRPASMAKIYSAMHQNIQDQCNEAGIEILSPHYRAARDGNLTTIPASYLESDYEVPAFRVQSVPPPAAET